MPKKENAEGKNELGEQKQQEGPASRLTPTEAEELRQFYRNSTQLILETRYLEKVQVKGRKFAAAALAYDTYTTFQFVRHLGADPRASMTFGNYLTLQETLMRNMKVDQVAQLLVETEEVDGFRHIRSVKIAQGEEEFWSASPGLISLVDKTNRYSVFIAGTQPLAEYKQKIIDEAKKDPTLLQRLYGDTEEYRVMAGLTARPLSDEQLNRFNDYSQVLISPPTDPDAAPPPPPPTTMRYPEFHRVWEVPEENRKRYEKMIDVPPESPEDGDGLTTPADPSAGDQLADAGTGGQGGTSPGAGTGDGGVRIASIEAAGVSIGEEDLTSGNIEHVVSALLDERSRLALQINRNLQDKLVQPVTPSPQSPFVPGPVEVDFSIDGDVLRAMNGQDTQWFDSQRIACFDAVLKASPALAEYFALISEDGYEEAEVWQTMMVYGRFRTMREPLAFGDITYFLNPMMDEGGAWGIVLEAQGRNVTEALITTGNTKPLRLRRSAHQIGQPSSSWEPRPAKLFADDCPIGRFWAPQMSRYRRLISGAVTLTEEELVIKIFQGTRYRFESVEEMYNVLRKELRPVRPNVLTPPGSIVFGDRFGDLGVLMSNWSIYGKIDNSNVAYFSWQKFKPRLIWYPHE